MPGTLKLSLVQRRDLGVEVGDTVTVCFPNGRRYDFRVAMSPFRPRTSDFDRTQAEGIAIVSDPPSGLFWSSVGEYGSVRTVGGCHGFSYSNRNAVRIVRYGSDPAWPEPEPEPEPEIRVPTAADLPPNWYRGEDDGNVGWYAARGGRR